MYQMRGVRWPHSLHFGCLTYLTISAIECQLMDHQFASAKFRFVVESGPPPKTATVFFDYQLVFKQREWVPSINHSGNLPIFTFGCGKPEITEFFSHI